MGWRFRRGLSEDVELAAWGGGRNGCVDQFKNALILRIDRGFQCGHGHRRLHRLTLPDTLAQCVDQICAGCLTDCSNGHSSPLVRENDSNSAIHYIGNSQRNFRNIQVLYS